MTFKATVQVGDKTVTFEGPREFVEEQVEKYALHSSKQQAAARDETLSLPGSERQFVLEKKPVGHSETVAVLAFWLTEQGKAEFTEEDIRRSYLRAGIRPPKVVSQSLRDAGNRYDYIEGGGKRGTYRLTSHGDRTVRFDLPRNS